MARWSRPRASAKRAWRSTTRASGAIIRWSFPWPTRASRCTWSTGPAIGPATSRQPGISTVPSNCAARAGFREILLAGRHRLHANRALGPLGRGRRAVHLRHRRYGQVVRTGGRTPAGSLENAVQRRVKHPVKTNAAEATGECQAADRRGAGIRRHPHGAGARGRVHLPARQLREGLSHGGGDEGSGDLPRAEDALREGTLLLLHHQRGEEAGPRRSSSRPTTVAARRTCWACRRTTCGR